MEAVIDALESGDADIRNGKLHIAKPPHLLQRILQPMLKPQTKLQSIFHRFINIMTRVAKGDGAVQPGVYQEDYDTNGPQ
ncbi:hypothetical protein [Ketogulonicigenium robustum]|uniref:hypothetical protein n=1 Tax=Ketogulonicigenium robustum TaxID=92947 RepID=UPI000A268D71|nr:hypothetical protein [Ketogulonicigenium robustum]